MAAPQALDDVGVSARPAKALLASQLLSDVELDGLVERVYGVAGTKRRDLVNVLETGVKSLDDALDGGLESGKVVSVSSEAGGGGGIELCRTLLVSSMLKYHNSTAAVVDTTGNFDVLRLYAIILAHLQRWPDVLPTLPSPMTTSDSGRKVEDIAAGILDRVKIMRVFDFVGVSEAVGEIRSGLEGRRAVSVEKEDAKKNTADEEDMPVVDTLPKRTIVADSEDEDEEDEMLFDSATAVTGPAPAVHSPTPEFLQQPEPEGTKQKQQQTDQGESHSEVKFVLIDNLAQVLNPLLKKDYIQTNVQASAFLHGLANLTCARNLHTFLLNPTTTPRPPSPTRHPPQNPGQPAPPPPQQQPQQPPPPPSVFASSTAVPSLMNVLGRYVDMSLLVTRLPKRRLDARVFYSDNGGQAGSRGVARKRGVEMVGVLEVVGDRWGGRVGAWGTFTESDTGMKDLL